MRNYLSSLVLALGFASTLVWIVIIIWLPLHLLTSAISQMLLMVL
jgi:hypothetical protein